MQSSSYLPSQLVSGLCALALLGGCAAPAAVPSAIPGFSLSLDEATRSLAAPETHQWSTGLVTSEQLQALGEDLRRAPATRRIQTMSFNSAAINQLSAAPGDFNSAASGRISSAPSYHFKTKRCHWLTENGWLLTFNTLTGAKQAVLVGQGGDTFPTTAISLTSDGKRAYFVSLNGRLYAVDTETGAHISGSPFAMGGANAANVPFGTAPFIDPLTSVVAGSAETVYAVNATGTLFRFVRAGSALVKAQEYNLASNTGGFTEYFRSSPVVLGGKAVVTTWRRSGTTNRADDEGALLLLDTQCRTITSNTVAPGTLTRFAVPDPIWAPPAVDVDNQLKPTLAFFPAGSGITMVDMLNWRSAQSVPLAVDNKAVTSGSLANYAYTASGLGTITKTPATDAAAVVKQNNTVSTAGMYGAKQVSTADANQVYGYMKFSLRDTDVTTTGNVLRVVADARLDMRCTTSSNHHGLYNPPPPRLFRTHNLTAGGLGAAWTSALLPFATRPPHMDGVAFDQTAANLTARSSWELTRTGTSIFQEGWDYSWQARGLVTTPNQDVTIGMVHTQLHETPSLTGATMGLTTPRFVGAEGTSATAPRLVLTLSNAGFSSPTLSPPVSIDARNRQIFVASTNGLFKVSYASATNNWVESAANFADDNRTTYALTRLGRDGDAVGQAGVLHTTNTRFVENLTAPLFDGTYVYVQDNHPGYGRTSVTRFLPGASGVAPSLSGTLAQSSILLDNGGSDAQLPAPHMSYDYESQRLMIATYSATGGRAWVVNRK